MLEFLSRAMASSTRSNGTFDGDEANSTLETAKHAVGLDPDAEPRSLEFVETDEGARTVRAADIEAGYPTGTDNSVLARQARLLSETAAVPLDADRGDRISAVAREHASRSLRPSAYVSGYMAVFEGLIEDAFERVDADTDPIASELTDAVRASMVEMQVGVDEFARHGDDGEKTTGGTNDGVTMTEVFDAMPYPAFLIDNEHTMLEYNIGQRRLLDLGDDHREFIGTDCRETFAAATYSDGKRHYTLADKVAKNPRTAHEEWDVERVDPESRYTDHYMYEDTSVSVSQAGKETHIGFYAAPIFDESGDLKAVFELTEDRTDDVNRRQGVETLVEEVTETLGRIGDGDLSARAHFEDEHDAVDPALLTVTDEVNKMASDFERLVTQVSDRSTDLANSIDEAIEDAEVIDGRTSEQAESLENVASEMEDFSATMEEVAATSSEVADAADDARISVEDGVDAGERAKNEVDSVRSISDELRSSVVELDEHMTEISDVAAVIEDIAEQTNILALNANIEAARADNSGSFAVVADEVKQLANETQERATEIADRIEAIQAQTEQTVEEVERSHEHVRAIETEIEAASESLRSIDDRVSVVADGINEVADANDDQAATVEEVTSTVTRIRDDVGNVSDRSNEIASESQQQAAIVDEIVSQVSRLTEQTE